MPKFRVTGVVSGGKYLGEFEAASAEEAVEMALNSEAATVRLCHKCAGELGDLEVTSAAAENV